MGWLEFASDVGGDVDKPVQDRVLDWKGVFRVFRKWASVSKTKPIYPDTR